MATENILMECVKQGGNRQELHEAIRVHSMEAGKQVKMYGKSNDLIVRIKNDPAFDAVKDKLDTILKPSNFIGRAPEQVKEYVASLQSLFRKYAGKLSDKSEVRV